MQTNANVQPQPRTPILPTTEQIQQRYTELLGKHAPPLKVKTHKPTQPATSAHIPAQPNLSYAALHGLAGLVVRTLAPHSEAAPAAILLQLLAAYGNAIGPGPHCQVGATRHALNLFVVLVGESSKSRKGTSWNQIAQLFAEVDPSWLTDRVATTRLTARTLTHALRDQPAGSDRRVLALSEEFASVLGATGNSRGQLSPLLRCAWDHGDLSSIANASLASTGAHFSLIAHITDRELAANLHHSDSDNGFANRCLWVHVRRSQCLPEGGNLGADELASIAAGLSKALAWAQSAGAVVFRRSPEAGALWRRHYAYLSQSRPGLQGAATSRAEAQVLRLSAVYAALDCSSIIETAHLEAAFALWDYCSTGASQLFGLATGDSVADRIREALQDHPNGLSRTRISALFHGNLSRQRIDGALGYLQSLNAIWPHTTSDDRHPTTFWYAVQHSEAPEEPQNEVKSDQEQP